MCGPLSMGQSGKGETKTILFLGLNIMNMILK